MAKKKEAKVTEVPKLNTLEERLKRMEDIQEKARLAKKKQKY